MYLILSVAHNEIYELILLSSEMTWKNLFSLAEPRRFTRIYLLLSWIITLRENNVNVVSCDNIVIFADVKQTPHILPGYLLFKDFCETVAEEPIPQLRFYEEVRVFSPHTI